jgi:hypothetical protein
MKNPFLLACIFGLPKIMTKEFGTVNSPIANELETLSTLKTTELILSASDCNGNVYHGFRRKLDNPDQRYDPENGPSKGLYLKAQQKVVPFS